MDAISVQDLTKHYHSSLRREGLAGSLVDLFSRRKQLVKAVENVSFRVEQGETIGLIGPNGAGKSTIIKMLTGILKPTSGTLSVLGITPFQQRKQHAMQIGVVFGQRSQLWWDLAVIEAFRLLGKIYQVPQQDFQARLEAFIDILELAPILNRQVRKLSLGQRMRCDLAASLLHNPPVLFLDEPTIGMDVAVKARMRDFIRHIRSEFGTTICLTTHDTSDIEELCSRLILIDRGQVLFDDSLERFKTMHGHYRTLTIDFENLLSEEDLQRQLKQMDVTAQCPFPGRVEVTFNREHFTALQLMQKLGDNFSIRDFQTSEVKIEEIIRTMYEGFSS